MKVAVIILNWKRSYNVIKLIKSLKMQTIVPKIIVFNNNKDVDIKFDCDEQINSTLNLKCMPRWFILSQLDTQYVMSIDDDLQIVIRIDKKRVLTQ